MFVADGEKARRRAVAMGLTNGTHVEIVSGVKRATWSSSTARPDSPRGIGYGEERGAVSVAAQALRHSRAIGLLAAALAVSGATAGGGAAFIRHCNSLASSSSRIRAHFRRNRCR